MMNRSERPIALALRGLAKRFDRLAVDALDLTVYGGEFYALVGPNGAGKTTTLRMLVGLLRPDAGSIDIAGIDALANPVAAKQITAWLSDERTNCWAGSGLRRMRTSAAKDFRRACGRKSRLLARLCMIQSSSCSMNRSPASMQDLPAWSRTCCASA